jgi:hypothetical protein
MILTYPWWTSHPPQEQNTRVRIPPGYYVFGEISAMQLFTIDLLGIACVLKKRKKCPKFCLMIFKKQG